MLGVFSASNKNQYLGGKVRPARGAVSCDLPVVPIAKLGMEARNFFPDLSLYDMLGKALPLPVLCIVETCIIV
jgi:hypothetical protein